MTAREFAAILPTCRTRRGHICVALCGGLGCSLYLVGYRVPTLLIQVIEGSAHF